MDSPAPDDLAEITVYWRPGCWFCNRLLDGLHRAGVTPQLRNIWEDPEAAAFVRSVARGNETVPTVTAGDAVLVNPSPAQVLAAAQAGEPARD